MLHNAVGQTSYSSYNTALIDSFARSFDRFCTSIASSRRVSRRAIRQDRRRIQFLNEFYNHDLPIESIRKRMNGFFNYNWDFNIQNLGQITKYETRIQSKGNLNLQISFSTYRNEIVCKRLSVNTSTRTDCIAPNYFYGISLMDLQYLKDNIVPVADFPMHSLKYNGDISCDTMYFTKLVNSSDSRLFGLNYYLPERIDLLTVFSLDFYESHYIDADILRLVTSRDIETLSVLLDSPNFYIAIYSMEALKYLVEEKKVNVSPECAAKMILIETSDFPITWKYSDVIKNGVRYKNINVNMSMIKEKYNKALTVLNNGLEKY